MYQAGLAKPSRAAVRLCGCGRIPVWCRSTAALLGWQAGAEPTTSGCPTAPPRPVSQSPNHRPTCPCIHLLPPPPQVSFKTGILKQVYKVGGPKGLDEFLAKRKNAIPVVEGPSSGPERKRKLYITDHHHLACALKKLHVQLKPEYEEKHLQLPKVGG